MDTQSFKVNEPSSSLRTALFYCVDVTDGVTPELGEAGGQPEASVNGGAWDPAAISGLTSVGNGYYTATLEGAGVSSMGGVRTRYKSAGTREAQGTSFQVLGYDPYQSIAAQAWAATGIDGVLKSLTLEHLTVSAPTGTAVSVSSDAAPAVSLYSNSGKALKLESQGLVAVNVTAPSGNAVEVYGQVAFDIGGSHPAAGPAIYVHADQTGPAVLLVNASNSDPALKVNSQGGAEAVRLESVGSSGLDIRGGTAGAALKVSNAALGQKAIEVVADGAAVTIASTGVGTAVSIASQVSGDALSLSTANGATVRADATGGNAAILSSQGAQNTVEVRNNDVGGGGPLYLRGNGGVEVIANGGNALYLSGGAEAIYMGDASQPFDNATVTQLVTAVWRSLLADHSGFAGGFAEAVAVIRGLLQYNSVLDQTTYNARGLLTGARLRVFPTPADAVNGTNPITTLTVVGTSKAPPDENLGDTLLVTSP